MVLKVNNMKKHFLKLLSGAMALASALSCVQENASEQGLVQQKVFYANADESADANTKTLLNATYNVVWDKDDYITVFAADGKGTAFTDVTVDESGLVAEFKGNIALADTYFALYPAQANAVYSSADESITAVLPTVQQAVAGSFGEGANIAVAKSSADYLKFLNVGALVGVQCPSAYSPSSIKLVSRDPAMKMTGQAVISFNNGKPVAVPTSDAQAYVEFKGGFNGSAAYRKLYYFVVYPGEYKSGFDIMIKNAAGTHQFIVSNTSPLTLERNDNIILFNPEEGFGFGWNAPVEPEKVTAKLQGLAGVAMSWECKAGAELNAGYNIYVRPNGDLGNGTLHMTVSDPKQLSCLVENLDAGKVYDFGVQTKGTAGKKNSAVEWVCGITVPMPDNCLDPTGLAVDQIDDTTVRLTWNDNSGAETGYRVYKKTGDDVATADIAAGSTSYDFKWLTGGNVHSFGVQARGAYNNHSNIRYVENYQVLTWEELLNVDMGWQECLLPDIKYITQDTGTTATVTWTCDSGAETKFNLYVRKASEEKWTKAHLCGTHPSTAAGEEASHTFTNLKSGEVYYFGVQAQGSTDKTSSNIASVEYAMVNVSTSKYAWEAARSGAPEFADMTLCYGGNPTRSPRYWDKQRWKKSAVYTDENGQDYWFFDSFLALEFATDGYTYTIENTYTPSAGKREWSQQLSYWFDSENGFQALDDCIDEAIATAGPYPHKRYVIFSLPDPVYCKQFANKSSSTKYWGSIDGTTLDFSNTADRVKAYKWMIDQVRARFAAKNYKHIELAGFYILSESLSETNNSKYKKFTTVIPQVAAYCEGYNEGLYWIPYGYSTTDSGHNSTVKNWKNYDFTATVLQPNYYWESGRSWKTICETYINGYGMGMEFEFEGTHGESLNPCSSILTKLSSGAANPQAATNKARFRAYMTHCKNYGIYGKKLLVLYSGTNALYELAVSTDSQDKELYHEMAKFFIKSPLKKSGMNTSAPDFDYGGSLN